MIAVTNPQALMSIKLSGGLIGERSGRDLSRLEGNDTRNAARLSWALPGGSRGQKRSPVRLITPTRLFSAIKSDQHLKWATSTTFWAITHSPELTDQ
jgi:hypothetical protein